MATIRLSLPRLPSVAQPLSLASPGALPGRLLSHLARTLRQRRALLDWNLRQPRPPRLPCRAWRRHSALLTLLGQQAGRS